jgi:DNA repair protein RecO (recombination protein O)
MTHKTKGIVLRTVKYGETSVVTTIYTELFGVQTYIVKGVRQTSKKNGGKSTYFQPAAMLDMVVYHNELKNLQFIRDYNWSFLYQNILFDVIKNSVAMYIAELLLHSLKQPEANPELFYLIEDTLKQLDKGTDTFTANLPLYFMLQLSNELGFQIQGSYSTAMPVLDLQEGMFVSEIPLHPYYINNDLAKTTSDILNIMFYNDLEAIQLNRTLRRQVTQTFQQFMALHIQDFGEMRSLPILQEILG